MTTSHRSPRAAMSRATRGAVPTTPALALVLVAALALAGCGGSTPSAAPVPDPTAVPAGDTGPGRSFEPATGATLRDAVNALDTLTSYRFAQTQGGIMAGRIDGVVTNEPSPAYHLTMTTEGLATEIVQVGSDTWYRVGTGRWQVERGQPIPGDAGSGMFGENPALGVLSQVGIDDSDTFVQLAIEARNGVEVRHLRLVLGDEKESPVPTTAPVDNPIDIPLPGATTGPVLIGPDGIPVDENGMPVDEDGVPLDDLDEFDDFGMGFTGLVEAWLDVDTGRLVALRVDGTQDFGDIGPLPSDVPDAFLDPNRLSTTIDITGVNDPANVVEPPVVPDPTPKPSGDPEVMALLDGVDGAAAALDRYVYEATGATGSIDTTLRMTVVNRPEPALAFTSDMGGFGSSDAISIGGRTWSRSDGGPWRDASGDDAAPCMVDTCDAAGVARIIAMYRAPVETYRLVGTEEVDGVEAVHLASDADLESAELGGMTLPGTSDVWIAVDGGYIVRQVFTGGGISLTVAISRVDDPTLTVEPPIP